MIRIGSIPGRDGPNPYVRLFYQALERYDVEVGPVPVLDSDWMRDHVDQYDGIHVHWPEMQWRGAVPGWYRRIIPRSTPGSWRFAQLLLARSRLAEARSVIRSLEVAKAAGRFIIWTYHNTEPHDDKSRAARYGYAALARIAHLVIAHDEPAALTYTERYPQAIKPTIMPHGNYAGVYPKPRDRETVLHELELNPEIPVFGCVGRIRKYKGFVEAMEGIALLDGDAQLVVAGTPDDQETVEKLRQLALGRQRIKLIEGFVDDSRFSDILCACTGVLLPYRSVTGSGALLAALSLGRPVIVSDHPFFRSILEREPLAGVVVTNNDPQSVAKGIRDFLEVDEKSRSMAAEALADQYDWKKVISPVGERIQALAEGSAYT